MIIYFIIFSVIILLNCFSERMYSKSKWISYFISFIAIVILSVFAGIRANTVGTDIKVYGYRYYVMDSHFDNLLSCLSNYKSENLYHGLNYIGSKLNYGFNGFLFLHQFILISIVYVIAYREFDKKNFGMFIITYLFLWFNTSLNILRQSISIFLMLFAYKLLEDKKYFKYAVLFILSYFFHSSTILGMIIIAVVVINRKINITKKFNTRIMVLITIVLISFSSLNTLVVFLSKYLIGIKKYLVYFNSSSTNLNLVFFIYKIGMMLIIYYFLNLSEKNKLVSNEDKYKNRMLFLLIVLDSLGYLLSAFIKYGYRTSYIFLVYYIYLIPRIGKNIYVKNNRIAYKIIILGVLIGYWILRYVIIKYDGTIPYCITNII